MTKEAQICYYLILFNVYVWQVLVEKLRVPDTKVQEEIDARRSVDLEKAALGKWTISRIFIQASMEWE